MLQFLVLKQKLKSLLAVRAIAREASTVSDKNKNNNSNNQKKHNNNSPNKCSAVTITGHCIIVSTRKKQSSLPRSIEPNPWQEYV
jgi:hypothetical protein